MHKFHDIVMGSLDIAQGRALQDKHTELTPYHLFWGLLSHPQSFSASSLNQYKSIVDKKLKNMPVTGSAIKMNEMKTSSELASWITYASGHAVQSGRQEIAETDLLRFIVQILPELDIDPALLSAAQSEENNEVPEFLLNLNELAASGKLDPVIGRTKEIRAVMEILGRRSKNNPVLVGSAGVGKTAIVEGLAEAIHKGKVPDVLKDKTIYSLDLGQLMAGTKFRGEFEERIQALLKFVKGKAGNSILFIDELHQLVGAGKTDGAMDAANLLKPALARGELHCIGATTDDEYQKYILGDSALDRRFRSVPVNEPGTEDAIEILMGIREKLEIHHGIKISDEAVFSSVLLSDQYITNKFLPDKAIDLVDESASALKLSAEAMPAELVELEAEIRAKKTYSKVEKDNKQILNDVKEMEHRFQKGKEEWEKEVFALKQVSELKNQRDRLKFDLEQAEIEGNYEEASKIKYSLMPELEKKLESTSHNWILTEENIANVIARQTGIPLEKILKSKQDKILELEDYLKNRVYGQDEATTEIAESLVAAHAGLADPSKPLGSFLLMGPSGVGKTETAKSLCEFLFNSTKNLIRLDMSEYSEKHSVAKLIGAAPGYVGYDEGGALTEAVRVRPYSVILFDEIEKAHSDFADILLQILDDGRLTDNRGRTIDFKNTIILLTSNSKNIELDFKPEVLGRLDAKLDYHSLGKEVMSKLVDKQVRLLNERLKSKKLTIDLDNELKAVLCERGYDERYGARPLAAIFNKLVTRPLSSRLLKGEFEQSKTITVSLENDRACFKSE